MQSRFVRVSQKTLDELGAELFPGKGAGYRYDLSEFDAVQAEELERRLVSRHDHVENRVCRLTTRPGEEAVTKNDVECSYLTDFDVQMSSYAPSGSNDWARTGEHAELRRLQARTMQVFQQGVMLQDAPSGRVFRRTRQVAGSSGRGGSGRATNRCMCL